MRTRICNDQWLWTLAVAAAQLACHGAPSGASQAQGGGGGFSNAAGGEVSGGASNGSLSGGVPSQGGGATGGTAPGDAGTVPPGGGGAPEGGAADDASTDWGAPDASLVIQPMPIAAAVTHACAIRSGAVYCWGENQFGQLGNGTTTDSFVPVQVMGLTARVQAIAAGWRISCVVVDRNVLCSGNSGASSLSGSLTPVPVQNLGSGVQAIAAYANAGYALLAGSLYGWGGDFNFVAAPIQVPGLDAGVEYMGAGSSVVKNNAAYCWGRNDYGQLGNGTANGQTTPALVEVGGLTSGVTAIASGYLHVCALMNGGVYCWGDNLYGQLGHKPGAGGDNTCIVGIPAPGAPCGMSPVQVQGLPNGVTAITAGTYHNCAIANGLAYCWGANGFGELGDGTKTTTYQPVQVKNLTNVTAISAGAYPDSDGYDETCAVADGEVYCWGSNAYGQLGDGTTTDSSIPVKVVFPVDLDAG